MSIFMAVTDCTPSAMSQSIFLILPVSTISITLIFELIKEPVEFYKAGRWRCCSFIDLSLNRL